MMSNIQLTPMSLDCTWVVAADQERPPLPECKKNLVRSGGEAGGAHVLLGCGGGERFRSLLEVIE